MKRTLNREQFLALLRRRQGTRTQDAFARAIGVSPSYLTEIYKGTRTAGVKVLTAVGVQKKIMYEVVEG